MAHNSGNSNLNHSISFDDGKSQTKNTWNTWRLIPTTRPVVAMPTPIYNYVDIPGKSGSLDLTDYLTGGPSYSDRTGTFEFYIANEYDDFGGEDLNINGSRSDSIIRELVRELSEFFNGKKMWMTLSDDGTYSYYGRFFFKQLTPDPSHSKVTIEYRLNPEKYEGKDLTKGRGI